MDKNIDIKGGYKIKEDKVECVCPEGIFKKTIHMSGEPYFINRYKCGSCGNTIGVKIRNPYSIEVQVKKRDDINLELQ